MRDDTRVRAGPLIQFHTKDMAKFGEQGCLLIAKKMGDAYKQQVNELLRERGEPIWFPECAFPECA